MKHDTFEISHTSRLTPHILGLVRKISSRKFSSPIVVGCFLFFLLFIGFLFLGVAVAAGPAREAPAGFDNLTNGYVSQAVYDSARAIFEQPETIATGLGPIYNGESCVECHRNPISGGNSLKSVLRAGHEDPATGLFVPAPGGTLTVSYTHLPCSGRPCAESTGFRREELSSWPRIMSASWMACSSPLPFLVRFFI